MDILKMTVAAVIMASSYEVSAATYQFVALDNSRETKLCVVAASNHKSKLESMMRSPGERKRIVANYVTCNDLGIAHFANKYGAFETAMYLNRYTNKVNRIPKTEVTIRDIAAVTNQKNEEVVIVYIGTAK